MRCHQLSAVESVFLAQHSLGTSYSRRNVSTALFSINIDYLCNIQSFKGSSKPQILHPHPHNYPSILTSIHLHGTSTLVNMPWYYKRPSNPPTTTTSTTSRNTTSRNTTNNPTTSSSYSTNNHTTSANAPDLRVTWKCCQCNHARNYYNPHNAYVNGGAQCGNYFANKEREVGQKRCEHMGPCAACDMR